jgi:alcohol dehydrogenase
MTMPSFQHNAPALRLSSGASCLQGLSKELARLKCTRAVIFCGATLARSVLLDRVREGLGDAYAGVFAGVRAHSPQPSVEEGASTLGSLGADAVVAVGGGSAAVTARAATIVLAEGNDLEALRTVVDTRGRVNSPKLLAPKLPQLIVATTPSTAIVKAGTAVSDPATGERLALFDPKTRAQAIFLHPDLLMSAPRQLVLSSALDTLSLAIEGMTSLTDDPIADAQLIHAVRMLARGLSELKTEDHAELRGRLAVAAVLAGRGTDHTGAGLATVLGHAIGARCGIENGPAKAIVLPHVLRFNAEATQAGLKQVAAALAVRASGSDAPASTIDELEALLRDVGAARRLREVGVAREELPRIARQGMGDWFLQGNPRKVRDAGELETILAAAW